ncbi:tyrosine-type recombinase/integrase [Vibrio cortegadensis]|uniref:phage integrase n=1 Tax=Vibrio cortegadensis TaxID=1328770 RepID=UPI0021C47FBC|nr:tyrosine-type recombinase/integrase [Vibrio cortegadensis]MDN3697038.1 tyrosine-type recombinase/integrase [Vibrio cortegadensis]
MSIRKQKDDHKKPWLCECYPQGREGKRIRKRFATKGEATAFELYTMKQIDDKPWLGDKPDHRRMSELLETWWTTHGHTLKSGKQARDLIAKTIEELGNPIASHLKEQDYLNYRATRVPYRGKDKSIEVSPTTHNLELVYLSGMFKKLIKYNQWKYPNPLEAIDPIKTTEKNLAYLTKPQINDFFTNLASFNRVIKVSIPQLIVIAKICLATGARISEALTLTRSQVTEFKLTYAETKGKKNRSVPISSSLHQEILDIAVSGHEIFDTSYKDAWRYIKKALPGHVPSGQATHVLRHTFASHFMMNKGDILVLQRILGHTKIEQTMAYAHFAPEHLIQAVHLNPLEN